jgi:hypothetical protein
MDYITAIISRYEADLQKVKQDGFALQFVVKEQTRELCLAAVQYRGYALEYVKEQTYELCLEAVKHHGFYLYYVNEQTYEICLEAVKQHGYALQFVKDPLIIAQIKFELQL